METESKIIVIIGPNASGKSELAVKIAKKINGEIISADSRQVYKKMDIGTGKVEGNWKAINAGGNGKKVKFFIYKNVIHHCIDFLDPKKIYSAGEYKKRAQEAILDIENHGKIPIICGGTGFYVESALGKNKIAEIPADWKLRKKLEKKSCSELLGMLKKLKAESAEKIDSKNKRRLIRAIEIAKKSGRAEFKNKNAAGNSLKQKIIYFGINHSPETLKKRIEKRLIARIKQGMIQEAEKLKKQGLGWKRLDDIGLEYRYISRFLREKTKIEKSKIISGKEKKYKIESAYENMLLKLKNEIWHYAKRQMTWFRRLERNLKNEKEKIYWIKNSKEAEKIFKKINL